MREERWGPLTVRVGGGEDRHGGGSGPVVVLMHGFGAPGTDLVGLMRVLDVPRDTRFVFPEAPLSLPAAYGSGRAWWMLDMKALDQAVREGTPRDLRDVRPEGLGFVRDQVSEMLEALDRHMPHELLVVGGFSQGAMLACDLALHTDRSLAGLVLLSAGYVSQQTWKPSMPSRAGLPVYQSHGEQDALLSHDAAEALRDDLQEAGLAVTWRSFRGGHEIPMRVLDDLGAFIDDIGA